MRHYWTTGWFKVNEPNLSRAGSSRRFLETDPEFLDTWSMSPCLPNGVCAVCQTFGGFIFFKNIWALRNAKFPPNLQQLAQYYDRLDSTALYRTASHCTMLYRTNTPLQYDIPHQHRTEPHWTMQHCCATRYLSYTGPYLPCIPHCTVPQCPARIAQRYAIPHQHRIAPYRTAVHQVYYTALYQTARLYIPHCTRPNSCTYRTVPDRTVTRHFIGRLTGTQEK